MFSVPEVLKDRELYQKAVRQDEAALDYIPLSIKNNPQFQKALLNLNLVLPKTIKQILEKEDEEDLPEKEKGLSIIPTVFNDLHLQKNF